MTELTVVSSHGTITIDGEGQVLSFEPNETGDTKSIKHLNSITRFDLMEWCKHHGTYTLPTRFDILDLAYWYYDKRTAANVYVRADKGWRELKQEEKSNG